MSDDTATGRFKPYDIVYWNDTQCVIASFPAREHGEIVYYLKRNGRGNPFIGIKKETDIQSKEEYENGKNRTGRR